MQPAEARNYFSASYFSRDILIPTLFSSLLLIEASIAFPSAGERIFNQISQANVYLFLVYVFLFFALSVSSTVLFFRTFAMFNKSILSKIIKHTDYDIYYESRFDEITRILHELSSRPLKSHDEFNIDFSKMTAREKINIILRMAERIFPEGSLLLARHYAFLAVTSSLWVAQFILLAASLKFGSSIGVGLSCVSLVFLLAAIIGIVRAAASSEFDVIRACIVLHRMGNGFLKNGSVQPTANS